MRSVRMQNCRRLGAKNGQISRYENRPNEQPGASADTSPGYAGTVRLCEAADSIPIRARSIDRGIVEAIAIDAGAVITVAVRPSPCAACRPHTNAGPGLPED